jgi:hypothetical protein
VAATSFGCSVTLEPFLGRGAGLVNLVQISFSQLAVRQVLGKHMIGGNEDLMRDFGAAGTVARPKPAELIIDHLTNIFTLDVRTEPLSSSRQPIGSS